MKKFNMACSVVAVITIALFLVTLSQNMTVRTTEVYSFYFNDSQAVSRLYTELSSTEIADGIADFMNSWRPEEFQIYEDTGYDLQGIFDEDEGYNMMCVKRCVDISTALGLAALLLTLAIYWHLIRCDEKKKLRNSFRVALVISTGVSIAEFVALRSESGRAWLAEMLKLTELDENSALMTILGPDFISMAAVFFAILAVIVLAIFTYINYRLTRPDRIFY